MATSMSCRSDWTLLTASISDGDPVSEAMARCSRESACRCSAESAARSTACRVERSGCRWSPLSAHAGRKIGRARLDHPAEHQGVHQLGPAPGQSLRRRKPPGWSADGRPPCRRRGRGWCAPCGPSAGRRSPPGASPGRPPSGRPARAPAAGCCRRDRRRAGSRWPAARHSPRRRAVPGPPRERPRRGRRRRSRQRSSSTSDLARVVCSSFAPCMKCVLPHGLPGDQGDDHHHDRPRPARS